MRSTCSMIRCLALLLALLSYLPTADAFLPELPRRQSYWSQRQKAAASDEQTRTTNNDGGTNTDETRRWVLQGVVGACFVPTASRADGYIPAKRATAYRVDSTIPPTLLPIDDSKQPSVLRQLGQGSGTDKEAVFIDTVNLNNILNKAVFGAADAVSSLISPQKASGFDASFVCLGLPVKTSSTDVDLACKLIDSIVERRKQSTAIALDCPISSQGTLDEYQKTGDLSLVQDIVDPLYLPVVQLARSKNLDLVAAGCEPGDLKAVLAQGLEAAGERRSQYVADINGFISQTSDPKFKLYTDRSLLKDAEGNPANYFASRILAHEAFATAMAKYATARPDSLVISLSSIRDVRYLNGINGRIPRICEFLKPSSSVDPNAVTTILLNPTAEDSLSVIRRLRLEIGTGPDTLPYQTKISDYLWFSSSPKVSLIPRLMDG